MATVTLEVSDDLALRLRNVGERLPQLLTQALDMAGIPQTDTVPIINQGWLEAVDFLTQTPDIQQLIDFKLSADAQDRLEELLDKHRTGFLTPHEQAELETYRQLNHLFIILKARARASQQSL